MTRLLVLVEGPSEKLFVDRMLKPHLANYGVYVQKPIIIWTRKEQRGSGFRGGVVNWNQIRKSLLPLTSDTDAWITTLLDFYGLPDDFPGFQEISTLKDPHSQVTVLQQRFSKEINRSHFIPFLALHEFEAWLFSAPEIVAEHCGKTTLAAQLQKVLEQYHEPELINLGEKSHPKARLKKLWPNYKETSDGPIIMEKIGIEVIRNVCFHFAAWLKQLETLGR